MEQDMTIYTILRIDEADFGCEGRPEGYMDAVEELEEELFFMKECDTEESRFETLAGNTNP